jgi:hypothetical protein
VVVVAELSLAKVRAGIFQMENALTQILTVGVKNVIMGKVV